MSLLLCLLLAQAVEIPLAGYDAGAVRVPSAPEAWGGVRDAPDIVASYAIRASLDPVKHTVDGSETLTWKNRSAQPASAVYLHLYLNAFESSGSTFMREKGKTSLRGLGPDELDKDEWGHAELKKVMQNGRAARTSFVHPDGGPESDHTVVRVDLPEPVAPGASTTLDIEFHDQLPRVIARSGWFGSYHLVAQWFPKIGVLELAGERGATAPRWNCHEMHYHSEFYADFGNYDVEVKVPDGYVVGSTGKEVTPHHFVQESVHDFAWTAWDGFKSLTADWKQVKVTVLYPSEYEASARPALQATLDALTYFSDTLGPYPYRTVTAVIPPYNAEESGGMEYPTFFTTTGTRSYSREMPFVDFVTVHEFGHGYYYGLLASNEFEEPFLDEGMNDFWDARMMDARGDTFRVSTPWLRRLGIRLTPPMTFFDTERLGGAVRTLPDALADNSWKRLGSYGHVYSGTSVWFRDLEQRLGGDALARGFKEYYRRWKYRHPSTADLQRTLAEVSGQPKLVDEFFDQHVFGTQALDDRIVRLESDEALPEVGYGKSQEAVDKDVKAARKAFPEKNKDGPGPYPYRTTIVARRFGAQVPQSLLVQFAGGDQRLEWPAGERWHKWELTAKTRALSAQLDPERKIWADWNKLDDGRAIEPHRLASRRWTLEAGAWLQVALALLEAL